MRALLAATALLVSLAGPALAVLPDEMLDDPVLEARARELSSELRCLICQNQSIDDSNADIARDLRVLIRERLVAGDTDREVQDFLVERYGEYILLRPRFSAATALLWLAPAMLLVGGGTLAVMAIRRRSVAEARDAPLSEDEERRLAGVLGGDGEGHVSGPARPQASSDIAKI